MLEALALGRKKNGTVPRPQMQTAAPQGCRRRFQLLPTQAQKPTISDTLPARGAPIWTFGEVELTSEPPKPPT